MKVAPLIAVALILCIAFPGPIQAKKKKFCVGKDGNRYKEGEGYDHNEGKACVHYKCVKKKQKFVMKKKGKCASVDGEWSPWSSWSDCSATCGTSTRTRKRTCSSPEPSNAGKPCPGMDEEVEECSNPPCGSVENVNVTALELNVQSLNDSMQALQTTMQSILELITNMQSTTDKQGTCMSDLTSSDCPPSTVGKTGIVDGITANTADISTNMAVLYMAGLASNKAGIATNKNEISLNKDDINSNNGTCSSIQATATKLETCLGDMNSVSCPSSKGGKTSVPDAIMKNKDAVESHHPDYPPHCDIEDPPYGRCNDSCPSGFVCCLGPSDPAPLPCCYNGSECPGTGPPASSTVPTPEEKKEFNTVVVENGQIVEQKDTFDPNTGEVSLAVPAHGNVEEATIIMDTDSKVLMRSTETTCRIESVPEEVNPDDIKESNSTEPITEDIEKKSYSLVFDAGTATDDEVTKLSPTMAKECANKTIKKTEQKKVDKETFEKFINGSVITLELGKRRRRDTSSCDKPAKVCVSRPLHGCWRWPYGSGDSLHSISGNGFCIPCCDSTNSTSDLCSCTELTSLEKIQQCLGTAGKNGSCPNGFENVCGHCLVDTDVGVNASDCDGSCPAGRYLCGDECWPTWMKNNLVECSATGKCQDKRKSSGPPCNGTCLAEDSFMCGNECWRNWYKNSRWDCNGICQDKSTPCNDASCPDGRFFCESNCHRDQYKSYTKYCDGKCIWNTKPCNGSCDEGYTLCNKDDLHIDYYDYGYNYDSDNDNQECMDLSYIWLCEGKCHYKSKPCNAMTCDEGYTLCNANDVYPSEYYSEYGDYGDYDQCYESSSVRDCDGSCLHKEYPCNGTCAEGYILCDNWCVDLNSTYMQVYNWICNGKCLHKSYPCNETCYEGYTLCNDKCHSYSIDSSNSWNCSGKCQYMTTACNETCVDGYTFCNDRCYTSISAYNTWDCNGKCQYKSTACNETCDVGYTFCNDKCYRYKPSNTWDCSGKCQYKSTPCNGSCPDGYINCNGGCQNDDHYRLCDGRCLHKEYPCNGTCDAGYIKCNRWCESEDYKKLCLGKCIDLQNTCTDTCHAGNTTMAVGETVEMDCQMFNCTVEPDNYNWGQQAAVLITTNVTTAECTDSE